MSWANGQLRENFQFMVGKWLSDTSFSFITEAGTKDEVGPPKIQKPVPIVQNKFLAYLVYVIQTGLFLGGFFLSTYANVRPCVFLFLQWIREEINDKKN